VEDKNFRIKRFPTDRTRKFKSDLKTRTQNCNYEQATQEIFKYLLERTEGYSYKEEK